MVGLHPQDTTPSVKAAGPFDWHQYIILSKHFSSSERERLTLALEDISAFADDEGIALIKDAARRSKTGKVVFSRTEDGSSTGMLNATGKVKVNFFEHDGVTYRDGDAKVHTSLNALVIHELYHNADPMKDDAVFTEMLTPALTTLLAKHGMQHGQETAKEFVQALEDQSLVDLVNPMYPLLDKDFVKKAPKLQVKGYTHLAEAISRIPPAELNQAIIDSGLKDSQDVPKWEQDATRFTDSIMRKNHGFAEPWRGNYMNSARGTVYQEAPVLTHGPIVFDTTNFTADTLNIPAAELPFLPPSVKNTALDHPIPTAHVGDAYTACRVALSNGDLKMDGITDPDNVDKQKATEACFSAAKATTAPVRTKDASPVPPR